MDPFRDRVAVITGAGGGIGAAMAREFAGRGARIVLADIDETALGRVHADLEGRDTAVAAVPTDVTKPESVALLADEAFRRFGAVHIVCNNAGVALYGPLAQASWSDWEYTMSVNLWGVVNGIQAFVPRLIEQGAGGHVVNTASMSGLVGMEGLGVYCASKFAVVGLSESLGRELRPHAIGVSVLCPMMVETGINENTVRLRPAALRNESVAPTPDPDSLKGGVRHPEEVARRVARGIERGDLYILTHPEQRELLRRRAERLDRMFEPAAWDL